MKKNLRILFILLAAGLFITEYFYYHGYKAIKDGNESLVRRVIDGDTIELLNHGKVRYIGVDTPELTEKRGSTWIYKPRPYAEEAKDFNKKLVENKYVRLEFDVQKKDKYNRMLAYVFLNGEMANIKMVREGYAMIYTYPPNVKYASEFIEAQRYARSNKKGLWGYFEVKENKISSSRAKDNIGKMRIVEGKVLDTYITQKVLILKIEGNFKAVIFRDNLLSFSERALRSPDSYFKGKTVRVYGIIKRYKGSPEIIIHDPSQLEIVE